MNEVTKVWKMPYKIRCSITGKFFAVRHEVLAKRLANAGLEWSQEGFETLQSTYKSQEARRTEKEAAMKQLVAAK